LELDLGVAIPSTMDRIAERAARWGIESRYHDAFGHLREVAPDVLARLTAILARHGEPLHRKEAHSAKRHPRAWQGDSSMPQRVWGIAVQLYGLRSERNWGVGDFTDLAAFIDIAADHGAAAIGLNPLHALFDDHAEDASPYSPNSRLFLNTLYIDVEAVPGFPGLDAAGLRHDVEALRAGDLINYPAVARAKAKGLALAYENFRSGTFPDDERSFDRFRAGQGGLLQRFAAFEWLRRRHGIPWQNWPTPWRNADEKALARLRKENEVEVGFFEFVQWAAHEQLTACDTLIRRRGMPIGLYLDIAVGVNPSGFDAWHDRTTMLDEANIGAPPDILNVEGQNWGLAGINPVALERENFEPFRRMLRASMRYAGAVRLDHVLGLKRLFLIPRGLSARQGSYVRFPLQRLLAVIAEESQANRCIVIGEDLGTVPEGLRETLAEWGLWSYQVMMFEREEGGDFIKPEAYRANALAAFNTHDLATFAGWFSGHDLAVKRGIGADPGESSEERSLARAKLRDALGLPGPDDADFLAVARYLARTPSRLVMLAMEDVLGLLDQPNVPGTVHEHPNWRRRLPVSLSEIARGKRFAELAEVMAAGGRST